MIGNPDTGIIVYAGWVCDDCDHVMLVEEAPRVTEPERTDLPEPEIIKRELRARPSAAKISVGTSCLSKDLVWCECGRGLSLSGKWAHCPNCGKSIDQESYASAVAQAKVNGASHFYRDPEGVEQIQALTAQVKALEADKARLDWLFATFSRPLLRPSRGWYMNGNGYVQEEYHASARGALDAARQIPNAQLNVAIQADPQSKEPG